MFPETVRRIREKGGEDILVVGGGIIPSGDVDSLTGAGVGKVFGPGTPINDVVSFIRTALEGKNL